MSAMAALTCTNQAQPTITRLEAEELKAVAALCGQSMSTKELSNCVEGVVKSNNQYHASSVALELLVAKLTKKNN